MPLVSNYSRNYISYQFNYISYQFNPYIYIYIFSVLLFVTKNKDQFLSNSQVHKINTRQTSNLYLSTANLAIYQKGVYYSGIKIYNHLLTAIKDLSGDKNTFKLTLKSLVNETNLVHNLFSAYFIKFVYNLFMFQTSPVPSSEGTTVFMRHFVLVILKQVDSLKLQKCISFNA
jgi:hypothetical protein